MNETTETYFEVGNKDNIVVNSSILRYIEPTQGGSPQGFINSFEKVAEEEKSYFRIGRTIHLWAEDRENFHIAAIAKPAEKLGIVADAIIEWCKGNGEELTDQIYLDIARRCSYQANYKDETLISKVKEGAETYIHELLEADNKGKIYLSAVEAEKIEKACASIEKHPKAKELLFLQDNDFSEKLTLKETPIYWTSPVPVMEELIDVNQKALLDDVTIDSENKKVIINDLKTTSFGSYSYGSTFSQYKTWRQLSFYKRAIIAWSVQNNVFLEGWDWEYNIIAVETSGLFQCVVHSIDPQWIDYGVKNVKGLLKRIATHIHTDNWNYSLEELEGNYKIWLPFTEE